MKNLISEFIVNWIGITIIWNLIMMKRPSKKSKINTWSRSFWLAFLGLLIGIALIRFKLS